MGAQIPHMKAQIATLNNLSLGRPTANTLQLPPRLTPQFHRALCGSDPVLKDLLPSLPVYEVNTSSIKITAAQSGLGSAKLKTYFKEKKTKQQQVIV